MEKESIKSGTGSLEEFPLGQNLEDAIRAFSQRTVLVLGDVFLDEYLIGDANRISPEAPVPILKITETHQTLGGAANTAANIATLGGKSILIGLVGEDPSGLEFRDLCGKAGLAFHPVNDGRPTIRKTRVMGQRQQLLRLDREMTHPVGEAGEARILAEFRKHLKAADIVVLSDYAKGFFTERVCHAIIRETHAEGKRMVVDPRPEHGSYYVGCDYLTPNWKEAQGLLGHFEGEAAKSAQDKVGFSLCRNMDANVLMTLGPKGMAFFGRGGRAFSVPTEALEVYDVSGAGDTVVAMFALAKSAGCTDEDSVFLANRAAGIVVAKLGTATVTRDEVMGRGLGRRRILSRQDLAPLSRHLKILGKRLVTLNGSFDLMHAGHLHIIREAKKQGDVLLLGVNSDASVRRYKGPTRPIIPEDQRAAMLLALRDIDYVHIFDEDAPMAFLKEFAPDVHVNGSDYGAECIEAETVRGLGGRIHIVEKVPGLSTSQILSTLSGDAGGSYKIQKAEDASPI